jgi:hypothetical protein
MGDVSWPPDAPSESLPDALRGRFASLVHIMGRWSPLHRLGVLALEADMLSLSDARGASLFAVPAASVEARPHTRRVALHQVFFKIHAVDRWWYLAAHVPSKYERRSTHELVVRNHLREWAPRPLGTGDSTYSRRTANPLVHQAIWAACWLQALNMPRRSDGGGS